ncbi:hypothetical protein WJX72_011478 [[Myrmecia] bisecta]|uniref:Apple domain-containing protein n=1 Tax=[Myrmecia] bisecta TaxID=41462 RepID=A0AAW1PR09_9CHLO
MKKAAKPASAVTGTTDVIPRSSSAIVGTRGAETGLQGTGKSLPKSSTFLPTSRQPATGLQVRPQAAANLAGGSRRASEDIAKRALSSTGPGALGSPSKTTFSRPASNDLARAKTASAAAVHAANDLARTRLAPASAVRSSMPAAVHGQAQAPSRLLVDQLGSPPTAPAQARRSTAESADGSTAHSTADLRGMFAARRASRDTPAAEVTAAASRPAGVSPRSPSVSLPGLQPLSAASLAAQKGRLSHEQPPSPSSPNKRTSGDHPSSPLARVSRDQPASPVSSHPRLSGDQPKSPAPLRTSSSPSQPSSSVFSRPRISPPQSARHSLDARPPTSPKPVTTTRKTSLGIDEAQASPSQARAVAHRHVTLPLQDAPASPIHEGSSRAASQASGISETSAEYSMPIDAEVLESSNSTQRPRQGSFTNMLYGTKSSSFKEVSAEVLDTPVAHDMEDRLNSLDDTLAALDELVHRPSWMTGPPSEAEAASSNTSQQGDASHDVSPDHHPRKQLPSGIRRGLRALQVSVLIAAAAVISEQVGVFQSLFGPPAEKGDVRIDAEAAHKYGRRLRARRTGIGSMFMGVLQRHPDLPAATGIPREMASSRSLKAALLLCCLALSVSARQLLDNNDNDDNICKDQLKDISVLFRGTGATALPAKLSAAGNKCTHFYKGFDVTGVVNEFDLTVADGIHTACDCTRECIKRIGVCSAWVWKFTGDASGQRTCTLYSQFNLPPHVTLAYDIANSKNDAGVITTGALDNNPHNAEQFGHIQTGNVKQPGSTIPQCMTNDGKNPDPGCRSGMVTLLANNSLVC